MLYVFFVDTGTMLQFEMNYALESVAQLGEAIERRTRIPQDKQVLLVSGGESLDSAARVCSYSAGTDTNPIYLFSKVNTDAVIPPHPNNKYGTEQDLKERVEKSDSLESNYATVVTRTHLAQEFYESAREQTRVCEELVHDQHLMQQGWAAVVANLEDITANYRTVCENFKLTVSLFLQCRDDAIQLVENYKQDIEVLAKIPMIPALLEDWADLTLSCASSGRSSKEGSLQRDVVNGKSGSDESSRDGQQECTKTAVFQAECGDGGSSEQVMGIFRTLLQWIDAKDKRFSIEGIAELCTRCLNQIHCSSFDNLKLEAEAVMEAATKQELKEIKGLEERLCGLEQLMYEARRLVQEQKDMAMAFQQNQKRVSNLKDPSIFPDLCASHQRQLKVMLENQHRLMDIRRRCTKAKEELSNNLFHRLRWVVYSENRMFDMNSKLLVYLENTKRLRRTLDVIRQVHLSPELYLRAVCEVVRRRSFSQAYLLWTNDLACQLLSVHNEEVARRRDFHAQFGGHFLNSLFTGLEDMPPTFATQAPSPFDTHLPKLTSEDVQMLHDQLPELSTCFSLPDVDAITNVFLTKSVLGAAKMENKETVIEDKPTEFQKCLAGQSFLGADILTQKPTPLSIQTSLPSNNVDRGFESETDTEEFEKVGQSPIKLTCSEVTEETPASPRLAGPVSTVALLEVGVPELRKLQATPSPSSSCSIHSPSFTHSHLSVQHHQQTQQEFATTEYYIDDSMPSSYTESSGAKCQHPPAPELQRQLEDVNTLVALLQENLGNTRNEVERLRTHLSSAGRLVAEAVTAVREELVALRIATDSRHDLLCHRTKELLETLEMQQVAVENGKATHIAEKAYLLQQLTIEHELEMDALKQELKSSSEAKDEEIRQLNQELLEKDNQLTGLRIDMEHRLEEEVAARAEIILTLESRIADMREQIGNMQQQVDQAEFGKQQAIQEVQERLNHEYKTELESLRSRYRLMATASIERSPSDSNLERIERVDLIELMNHEAILQQVRDDMEDQREAAIKAAVDHERTVYEERLEHELRQARTRSEAERQVWFNEAMRRVVEEKERQMEVLRTREITLMVECQKYQDTIRHLTDCREAGGSLDSKMSGSTVWQLLDRIELLKAEKRRVENELARERNRKTRTLSETAAADEHDEPRFPASHEMSSSVAVVQDASSSRDVATSPDPDYRGIREDCLQDKLSQSTTTLIQQGKISITSCNIGDVVLIVWNEEHQNYIILQETSTFYFLHLDCLDTLGLRVVPDDDAPRRLYSTGEVIEKEYCHAKKAENRYRVPKGTKFYRVKVRPVQRENILTRSHHYPKQKQQHHHHGKLLQQQQQQQQHHHHHHHHHPQYHHQLQQQQHLQSSGTQNQESCEQTEHVYENYDKGKGEKQFSEKPAYKRPEEGTSSGQEILISESQTNTSNTLVEQSTAK